MRWVGLMIVQDNDRKSVFRKLNLESKRREVVSPLDTSSFGRIPLPRRSNRTFLALRHPNGLHRSIDEVIRRRLLCLV
jgi:hypothetical protein